MKETDLINDILQRRDGAMQKLALHYGPLIRYIIAPILPDQRDREEVFSDCLLRIWDRADQYDPQSGSFKNWICTLTRNAAIDRARRTPPPHQELTDTVPAENSDPEQELLRKERLVALNKALYHLTYDERALFYRKYYYRQSTAQIAAEYSTTERSIEGKLYRIKKKLRNFLGGEGFD